MSEEQANYVLRVCARHFGLEPGDLTGPCRTQPVSRARHVGMYVSRILFGMKLVAVAAMFSRRTHRSVIEAVRKVEGNPDMLEDAREIMETIRRLAA